MSDQCHFKQFRKSNPNRNMLRILSICALLTLPVVYSRHDCLGLKGCVCQKNHIQCRQITEIPKLPPHIQQIDLSNNAITELKKKDFTHNKITELLYLSDNKISEIDEDTFDNLTELKYLNLSNNRLGVRQTSITFKNNEKLKQLDLSNNPELVFSVHNLPAHIEDVNLFNTSSAMPYDLLKNLIRLRKYSGDLCLSDNCSHKIELNAEIIRTESTVSTTEKSSSTTNIPKTINTKGSETITEKPVTTANAPVTSKPIKKSQIQQQPENSCHWNDIKVLVPLVISILQLVAISYGIYYYWRNGRNGEADEKRTNPTQSQETLLKENYQ